MTHTKGKLHLFTAAYPAIDICAGKSYICSMALEKENNREQALEDARRIIALWNAAAESTHLCDTCKYREEECKPRNARIVAGDVTECDGYEEERLERMVK